MSGETARQNRELFEASYIERKSEKRAIYDCPICSNSFSSKDEVENHVKNHIQILTPKEINNHQDEKRPGNNRSKTESFILRSGDSEEVIVTPTIPHLDGFGSILSEVDVIPVMGKNQKFKPKEEYSSVLIEKIEKEPLKSFKPKYVKKKEEFVCEGCNKGFKTEYHLNLHGKKVHKFDYKCSRCHKPFNFASRLREHEDTHMLPLINESQKELWVELHSHLLRDLNKLNGEGGEEELNCTTNDLKNLNGHMEKGKNIKNSKKQDMDVSDNFDLTAEDETMDIDDEEEEEQPMFPCELCDKSYKTESVLKRHHTLVHQREKECFECGQVFENARKLKYHELTHSTTLPHKCKTCGKSFKMKQHLSLHEKTHNDVRPYSCEQCPSTFKLKQQLQTHVIGVHSDLRSFECDICQKSFKLKQQLQLHMNVHSEVKQYICEFCEKGFTFKAGLDAHYKIHLDIRDFPCTMCEKKFRNKQALETHEKIHMEIKEFTCSFCGKMFRRKQTLELHEKIHLGIKDFSCEMCDKNFRTKQQLQLHCNVHENEIQEINRLIMKEAFDNEDEETTENNHSEDNKETIETMEKSVEDEVPATIKDTTVCDQADETPKNSATNENDNEENKDSGEEVKNEISEIISNDCHKEETLDENHLKTSSANGINEDKSPDNADSIDDNTTGETNLDDHTVESMEIDETISGSINEKQEDESIDIVESQIKITSDETPAELPADIIDAPHIQIINNLSPDENILKDLPNNVDVIAT